MALTKRQSFKVAFLQKCADDGLSFDETCLLVKRAADALEKRAVLDVALKYLLNAGRLGLDVGRLGVDTAMRYGLPAALLAPPAIGAVGGYAAAKLTGGSDESPDDIKTREKIDAYRSATAAAKASTGVTRKPKRRVARGLF